MSKAEDDTRQTKKDGDFFPSSLEEVELWNREREGAEGIRREKGVTE